MKVKPIGVLQMLDGGERDDKIIAVHCHDPAFCGFTDISELPAHRLLEIRVSTGAAQPQTDGPDAGRAVLAASVLRCCCVAVLRCCDAAGAGTRVQHQRLHQATGCCGLPSGLAAGAPSWPPV